MSKKRIIIYCSAGILIIICIIFFILNPLAQKEVTPKYILTFAIFPTSSRNESYYFILSEDGILKCSKGIRESDDIEQTVFIKRVTDSSEKILTIEEIQIITDLSNELEKSNFISEKHTVFNGWNVALIYNEKTYEGNYDLLDSEIFLNLINKIIELSPIEVKFRCLV